MNSTEDIRSLKKKYDSLIGKDIILKLFCKNKNKNNTYKCILEGVTEHCIILKKEVRPNLYLIETFSYNLILSNAIEIIII